MSILSDSKILAKIYSKELEISPLQVENIQPASIDLTLDESIETPKSNISIAINPPLSTSTEIRQYFSKDTIKGPDGYTLKPGEFVLGQIKETIALSDKLVGNIQNRNSLIRLGINVGLSTFINPGYKGKLPIAIHNIGTFDFKLIPGMRICQLVLSETNYVLKDYSKRETSKYHAEKEITLSKLSEDSEFIEYVKKFGKNPNIENMANFLFDRISANSKDFISQLNAEQKQELGIH